MATTPQLLVEPGNPFGFDSTEFAELVDDIREDLGPEYDVRVAYREQVGAAVTLYEVVDFWLSWQSWSAAAQGVLVTKLLEKSLDWRKRCREAISSAPPRPFWARIITMTPDKAIVVAEIRIEELDGEAKYGPFSEDEESQRGVRKGPPPIGPWPPKREDLPQRPAQELASRRLMLDAVHAAVREAQRQERESVVFDSAMIAGIGKGMGLNTAESKGLFTRLVEGGYVRLRSTLGEDVGSGELRAEVEYLTDLGLREIGEL